MMVLICLAVAWAAIVVPSLLRRQREGRPGSSVVSFRQQLSTLERATPGSTLRPMPNAGRPLGGSTIAPRSVSASTSMGRSQVVRRRRDILVGLLGTTGATFLLALVVGGAFLTLLFLASGASLGAYVYALVQMRKRASERSAKVRVLRPHQAPASSPVLALRRTVSN